MAQIIDKLYAVIATDNAVCHILCISRACCATEGCILICDIINTNLYLSATILKYLLTQIEVAEQILLVVVLRDTYILIV